MGIQTILFDFGGVIVETPNIKKLNRWKKILGLAGNPEVEEMLANPSESKLLQDIFLGVISEDYIWNMMAEKWHIKPDLIRWVRRRLFSKRHLNKPFLKYMASLQPQYQTAILSNAGDQARRLMEDVYHIDDYVEEIIISAEEGVIKPDPRIYQIAMQRLNASPKSSLLIDDNHENIEAAREFGMYAVQFINNQQAIQAVKDCLSREG